MIQWLVYFVRLFVSAIVGGVAAVCGIMASTAESGAPGLLAVGGLFAMGAFFSWPRRPNAWRSDRPTDRQLAYAKDLGIAVPRGASKGEVSDMISSVTGR